MAANANLTPFYVDIDLTGNQLLNAVLHSRSDTLFLTTEGQIGYNEATHRPVYRNNNQILELASLTGIEVLSNKTLQDAVLSYGVSGSAITQTIRASGTASNTIIPSEAAVRAALDSVLATGDAMVYVGTVDCSTNPNYPAASKGDTYKISVAGKIGGSSGVEVQVGDMIICNTDDTAAGNQATVGAKWDIIQTNIVFPLTVAMGGTGITTLTVGDLLYANSTSTLAKLAVGSNGDVLTVVNGLPQWSTPNYVTSFIALTDTPSSYTGAGNKLVRVNSSASGLEFWTLPTYDNYSNWKISATDAAGTSVTSGQTLAIVASGAITTSLSAGTTAAHKLTISHSTAAGYVHLPSGGSTGQWLKWASAGNGAWTSPASLSTSTGKGLLIGGSASGSYNLNAAATIEVDFTQVAAYNHSHPGTYDNYESWNLKVNAGTATAVTSGYVVDLVANNGITATLGSVTGGKSITFGLTAVAAYTIKANAGSSSAVPGDLAVNTNSVVGRLSGDIVNIAFGTSANTVAWGNHTHSQLHNRQHNITNSSDHIATCSAGQFLIGTGTNTFDWSTLTLPNAASTGGLMYASTSNTMAILTIGSNGTFLKSNGTTPSWQALALSDIPSGIPRYSSHEYSNATTKTITAAEHGCGLKPFAFLMQDGGTGATEYVQAHVSVKVNKTTGDVTISTNQAMSGKVIIIGS